MWTSVNARIHGQVAACESGMENVKQYIRRDMLELHGIPVTRDENPNEIVKSVVNLLDRGHQFHDQDISISHRLPAPEGKIPPIIVKFTLRNTPRWSGDVIRRTGMKNFNAVSHKRARPYFRIQHGRDEVRTRRVYLNVHSVTGNVVDTEWSVEFWRWKWCREFGNNTFEHQRPRVVVGYGLKIFSSQSSKLRHQITWRVPRAMKASARRVPEA